MCVSDFLSHVSSRKCECSNRVYVFVFCRSCSFVGNVIPPFNDLLIFTPVFECYYVFELLPEEPFLRKAVLPDEG